MRKPDALRTWLERSVKGLADHPDRLHLFRENGRFVCVPGETLSYFNRYTLTLVVEDFAEESHVLFVPILAWLAEHQPDLLEKNPDGIPFEQDILDNKSADFEIKLDLAERVVVTATAEGGWQVTYPTEVTLPVSFEGAGNARLWRLYLDSHGAHDLVAVHPDHLP